MNKTFMQGLLIGAGLTLAPQFFTASNLQDFSEVKNAVIAACALAVTGIVKSAFGNHGKDN